MHEKWFLVGIIHLSVQHSRCFRLQLCTQNPWKLASLKKDALVKPAHENLHTLFWYISVQNPDPLFHFRSGFVWTRQFLFTNTVIFLQDNSNPEVDGANLENGVGILEAEKMSSDASVDEEMAAFMNEDDSEFLSLLEGLNSWEASLYLVMYCDSFVIQLCPVIKSLVIIWYSVALRSGTAGYRF